MDQLKRALERAGLVEKREGEEPPPEAKPKAAARPAVEPPDVPPDRVEPCGRGELRYWSAGPGGYTTVRFFRDGAPRGAQLEFDPRRRWGQWELGKTLCEIYSGGTSTLHSPWHDGADPQPVDFDRWVESHLEALRKLGEE